MTRYIGHQKFRHDNEDVTGVLISNLGTPDAPDRKSVRRYLKQFLSDPRVVEFPRPLWWLILNGVILNIRPSRSARAYRKVWTESGSPLLDISTKQVDGIRSILAERFGDRVQVEVGMRYGNPSIAGALDKLGTSALRDLVVLPLYPQYSGSTVGSVFDEVANHLSQWRWVPGIHFINAYHDHPGYIEALAGSVLGFWREQKQADHLVMSFHGVPKQYLLKGDPYYCQCHKTARLLARRLDLSEAQWSLVFQSRMGRQEWLQPYCDEELKKFPARKIKDIDILCPGFSADCLETLEEINMQYRRLFLDSGGHRFNYIPCLNDGREHLKFLAGLIQEQVHIRGDDVPEGERQARLSRAKAMGASR
jgi:ferrochelatase